MSIFKRWSAAFSVVALMMALAIPSKAWITVQPPWGELTAKFAYIDIQNGQVFQAPFRPDAIWGYAHAVIEGSNEMQSHANMSYYTIDVCRDVNKDGKIGDYEVERGMAFRTILKVNNKAVGYGVIQEGENAGNTFESPDILFTGTNVVWLGKGWWFFRIRAVDAHGNTTNDVGGVDMYEQQGEGIKVTTSGNPAYGWDADSILFVKVE